MGISRKTLRKRRHLASASRRRSRELSTAAFEAERERVFPDNIHALTYPALLRPQNAKKESHQTDSFLSHA